MKKRKQSKKSKKVIQRPKQISKKPKVNWISIISLGIVIVLCLFWFFLVRRYS